MAIRESRPPSPTSAPRHCCRSSRAWNSRAASTDRPILAVLPVVPFDDAAADVYRTIVEAAGYSRRKLLDRMIGAQAIVHRATLVTRNAGDFEDIPGLLLEAW